jgi:ATP-dependent Lhr-like helicase
MILRSISLEGGATAAELWTTLVRSEIFDQVGSSDFSDLLQALGARDLITQDHGGSLLPGVLGEKLINQFDFYSAFSTGEEFRLIAEGRVLGSLPIEKPLTSGQRIIFGGRRWKVLDIDTQGKAVYVVRDRGGAPPSFDGIGGVVHDRVREEMKQVLTEVEPISFLDSKAAELLEEARQWFKAAGVGAKRWSVDGHSTLLFRWHGDTVQDALALLLTAKGMQASNEGVAMRISSTDHQRLLRSLQEIGTGPVPTIFDLKVKPEHAIREKWDWVLPEGLLLRSFASAQLDLLGARRLALMLSQEPRPTDRFIPQG